MLKRELLGTLCALSAISRTVGGQVHSDVANLVIQGLDAPCIMAEADERHCATARAEEEEEIFYVSTHDIRTYDLRTYASLANFSCGAHSRNHACRRVTLDENHHWVCCP